MQVVIKAANGKVSDFTVSNAEPRWTVAELKNYLYRHYPTHPVSERGGHVFSGEIGRRGRMAVLCDRESREGDVVDMLHILCINTCTCTRMCIPYCTLHVQSTCML